jgi:hypothetical protein
MAQNILHPLAGPSDGEVELRVGPPFRRERMVGYAIPVSSFAVLQFLALYHY